MTTSNHRYPKDAGCYPIGEPASIGKDPAWHGEVGRLAPSRVTVLLVGGDAVLQRAVAQALHDRSPRGTAAFESVDCYGLDSEQVELRLFGGPAHAPLGEGAIQRAGAGTLYVAGIDELPLLVQPRFLRFLDQERQARVVASAASELTARVVHGKFRRDLAERLSLVELSLPTPPQSV